MAVIFYYGLRSFQSNLPVDARWGYHWEIYKGLLRCSAFRIRVWNTPLEARTDPSKNHRLWGLPQRRINSAVACLLIQKAPPWHPPLLLLVLPLRQGQQHPLFHFHFPLSQSLAHRLRPSHLRRHFPSFWVCPLAEPAPFPLGAASYLTFLVYVAVNRLIDGPYWLPSWIETMKIIYSDNDLWKQLLFFIVIL